MRKSLVKQLAIRLGSQTMPAKSLVMVKRPDLPTPDHSMAGMFVQFKQCTLYRKLTLQMLGITAGLMLSVWGYAVGLGGINVVSALGQPLKAEIELVAVSKADKPGLVARLASPETYKGAGLDYPFGIKYNFQIENHANGEPYLKLTSTQNINDPFVSLLVELSWSSGKLMREYTFLLDPPGYVAEQPKPAAVQPVAPQIIQAAPTVVVQPVQPEKLEEAKPVVSAANPVAKPAVKMREVTHQVAAETTVTVRSGDTLNKIAARNKPDQVSLERMLVALYRTNEAQFDGSNMNRIRTGKILRMPDNKVLNSIDQAEAIHEIHAQADDWNAYRQKLAGAAAASHQSVEGRQAVSGKVGNAAVDKAPVADESAREVLRLSKGEAPGDKTGAAGKSAQKNAAAEEEIAKSKAVAEDEKRAALLENNLKDMKKLAQLKSEAAALSVAAASKVVAVSAVTAPAASAAGAVSASAVAAASHVQAASAVKSTVVEEPSLLDKLLGSPLAMGIGAAVLVALGGLGIVLGRRRRSPAKTVKPAEEEVGTVTGQLTNPVIPSPDTGDFTAIAAPVEELALHPDDVDPISEAELFLNFGRDEQAEEVLKDALSRTPDNHKIHLKLLGIYANRQDVASFAEISRLLQDSGDIDAIEQAAILERKLYPVNPPKVEESSIEDDDSATQFAAAFIMPDKQPVDLDIAGHDVEAETLDFDITTTMPVQQAEVDFDVTSTNPALVVPEVLDFDISANELDPVVQPAEEEPLPDLDDLIFDVTSAPVTDIHNDESLPGKEDSMDFALDFAQDNAVQKMTLQPAAINLAGISLEMDDIPAPVSGPAEAVKSEQWHEVATKLDLAKAYQEMGDDIGAREILDEVMIEGDEGQQHTAQLLIKQMG